MDTTNTAGKNKKQTKVLLLLVLLVFSFGRLTDRRLHDAPLN